MPLMSELVPDYDMQIRVWEAYRDMVRQRYNLSYKEATKWANRMMKYNFDFKKEYGNKD